MKSLQRMNLDPVITQKLFNKRFSTAKDVLVATEFELVEALDLPYHLVEQLALHVSSNVAPQAVTVSPDFVSGRLQSASFAAAACIRKSMTLQIFYTISA